MNLENLLDKLLKEGKIKKQDTDVHYLNGLLNAAHNNFRAAKYNLDGGFLDTAFKSAYDGLLQISRVVLFLNGYRPDDGEQHKTTFMVAGSLLGDDFADLIGRIDRYRIKRNGSVEKERPAQKDSPLPWREGIKGRGNLPCYEGSPAPSPLPSMEGVSQVSCLERYQDLCKIQEVHR